MPKTKTSSGLDSIRDFLASEIADIAVGTDGTSPSTTDTSLGNVVITKSVSNTKDGGVGEVTHVIRVKSGEANGEALRELGTKDSSGELEDRFTFSEINKTSDFEIEFRVKQKVRNP